MPISHEEAQRLIQFKLDGQLNPDYRAILGLHLSKCPDCRAYLRRLRSTESIIRTTLHQRWNKSPLPLQMVAVYLGVHTGIGRKINALLATRAALVGITFVLFSFMAWQSMAHSGISQKYPAERIPLIPTPSMSYTATKVSRNDCRYIKYGLQEDDTLDDIARQFSVPAESIILANNLTDESLESIRELLIPVCGNTPTGTTYPPTFTITPIFDPMTGTTPG